MVEVWNNPDSYKSCSKKFYEAYVCMPPSNTVVINKLEYPEVISTLGGRSYFSISDLKHLSSGVLNAIKTLAFQGKAYIVSPATPFVVSGTMGELTAMNAGDLAFMYCFLQNGQPVQINQQTLTQRLKDGCLDWTVIRLSQKAVKGSYTACFVPKNSHGKLQKASGAVQEINGAGVDHGKGDFVVCPKLANGKPDMMNREVVNGKVFAETFNNQGWGDCVTPAQSSITIKDLPKLVASGSSSGDNTVLFDKLFQILSSLSKSAVAQMPFSVRRASSDSICVTATAIESYKKTAIDQAEEQQLIAHGSDLSAFKSFITLISVKDGNLQFQGYNVFTGGARSLTFAFELPASEAGLVFLQNNLGVYAGFMGYVPNGIQNNFQFTGQPSKFEFDGIHAYTVNSAGINRKLRLQDRGYEKHGVHSQGLARIINGCDKYFDKVTTRQNMVVFRGMPANVAFQLASREGLESLSGGVVTNTAYTSSTTCLNSSMLFARVPKTDPKDGIIFVIQVPVGVHADYIHGIAGWKEQFEVLWDRKYDLGVGEHLMDVKGGKTFTFHVYKAYLIEHQPLSGIPAWIDTSKYTSVPNINLYDENGRINFAYTLVNGYIRGAFELLKAKGVSVQIQNRLEFDPLLRDFIVVRQGENDSDTFEDLGFTWDSSEGRVLVIKIYSEKLSENQSARNYWTDANRNKGTTDQNYYWYNYSLEDSKNARIAYKSSLRVKVPKGVSDPESHMDECIAHTILEYVKYNKDVSLLPMQEVARYFDVVFKSIVTSEGYELQDSAPVLRVGSETDENDGYVPFKYKIDGDVDDTLTLLMRMSRGSDRKLQLEYRGTSANNRVKESDKLRWNVFNQDVMERECRKILYVFASKLNLNHTRKVDRLLKYVARNRRFILTESPIGVLNIRNIHARGNKKQYKLWFSDRKRFIGVTVEMNHEVMRFNLVLEDGSKCVFDLNSKLPVFELYHEFVSRVEQRI